MFKTLIHCALLCEAQALINYYKLSQHRTNPTQATHIKIYSNDTLLIVISGIGKINTQNTLEYIFKNYQISKAINLGIAGCVDKNIKIGSLFCTNKKLENISHASITTLDTICTNKNQISSILVDMESQYFEEIVSSFLEEIYIIKVVSDHLEEQIPKKSFVIQLIQNTFKEWKHLL